MHANARSCDGPEWNGRSMHAYGRVGAASWAMPQQPFPGNSSWHDACTCTTRAPSSSSPPGSIGVKRSGAEEDEEGFSRSIGRSVEHDLDAMVRSFGARAGLDRQFGFGSSLGPRAHHMTHGWVLRSGCSVSLNEKLATGQVSTGDTSLLRPRFGRTERTYD